MSWLSLDLATALIGVLAGFIFFFDGWRRSPKEILPFHQTPRITGLVWVVSGGAISGFLTYIAKAAQGRAMIVYVASFGLSLIACLFLAGIAVAVYYIAKYGRQKSFRVALVEAIPFTLFFLANGLDIFLDRLSEAEKSTLDAKTHALERSRIYVLQFVNDVNAGVNSDILSGRTGLNYFRGFLAVFLRTFIAMFFEEKEFLEKFRAGFYQRQGQDLVFVEGADVKGSGYEFSGRSLELRASLAGRALLENRIMHFPEDSKEAYQRRSTESPYKCFVVVPVPFKPETAESERIGVLCVDSVDPDAPFNAEFQRRLLIYFSNVIASASLSYRAK